MNVEVQFDEDALRRTILEAVEDGIPELGLSYPCPDCGEQIAIIGKENECACGFILRVELDRPLP